MSTALRIKSHWFRPGQARTPEQNASAMAFIAWRVAVDRLKRLRSAGFDIDAGPTWFGVVRELLVFLLAGIDRIAYARLGAEGRAPFTEALVRRVAEILEENEADLLGPAGPGGDGAADYRGLFIEQFNTVGGHYAEFGWDTDEGPDFAFMRYLGSRLAPLLPEKDRRWVVDQVIAVEAPEAAGQVQRAMADVLSTEPRRARRAAMSGD